MLIRSVFLELKCANGRDHSNTRPRLVSKSDQQHTQIALRAMMDSFCDVIATLL